MKRLMLGLPLLFLVSACAGGPPPEPPGPPPLDPVGVYDCAVFAEGMELAATLTITGEEGAYSGSIQTDMGPGQVSDIVVDGQNMTFIVDTGDMTVWFAVVFDGDKFTGEFDAGGMGGSISGTKR